MRQMNEKTKKYHKMSSNEFAINKPLLREANTKFKDASVNSRAGPDDRSVQ